MLIMLYTVAESVARNHAYDNIAVIRLQLYCEEYYCTPCTILY